MDAFPVLWAISRQNVINRRPSIGVGIKYDELEIEIGVVKFYFFSNSQSDFSKLDILLCPKIENGIENEM